MCLIFCVFHLLKSLNSLCLWKCLRHIHFFFERDCTYTETNGRSLYNCHFRKLHVDFYIQLNHVSPNIAKRRYKTIKTVIVTKSYWFLGSFTIWCLCLRTVSYCMPWEGNCKSSALIKFVSFILPTVRHHSLLWRRIYSSIVESHI